MKRTSRRAHPGRQLRDWVAMVLGGGVWATVFLVATVTAGQTGGLFDWLFIGKGVQRVEAPVSQGNAPLATVRLHVDGMVCYG